MSSNVGLRNQRRHGQRGIEVTELRGAPILLGLHDQLWLFHGGAPSKIGDGTNRTGGSTILKLIWGGNLLHVPGFGDPQPYETWKFRICSESVSGVFPDLFRILFQKCLTVLGAPPKNAVLRKDHQFCRSLPCPLS